MLKKLRERAGSEKGFTLIELLVVMLILGILAAIAIPAFLNQKQKASDANAKVAARTAVTAMATYSTDNGSAGYTGATVARLQGIESSLNDARITLTLPVAPTATTFSVRALNISNGHSFTIAKDDTTGTMTGTCAPFGTGGCPPSPGNWLAG